MRYEEASHKGLTLTPPPQLFNAICSKLGAKRIREAENYPYPVFATLHHENQFWLVFLDTGAERKRAQAIQYIRSDLMPESVEDQERFHADMAAIQAQKHHSGVVYVFPGNPVVEREEKLLPVLTAVLSPKGDSIQYVPAQAGIREVMDQILALLIRRRPQHLESIVSLAPLSR